MAKSFTRNEAVAGVLDAINMVSTEMGKEQPNEKRAGEVAMAAVKVAADSNALPDVGELFNVTGMATVEQAVEAAVEKIAAPPTEETKQKDEIPF